MRLKALVFSLVAFTLFALTASAQTSKPYYGNWSNGRGEVLTINDKSLNKKTLYKDITQNQSGNKYWLEITKDNSKGYFSKFLELQIKSNEEMFLLGYDNLDDMKAGRNAIIEVTWYKDSDIKIQPSADNSFSDFWKTFQAAVTKGDKNKVAELTNFPILGDADFIFTDDNGKTYPNNASGFVAEAFKKIFYKSTVKYISKIKNTKSGKVEGNVMYKFTSLKDLAKDGSLPDFLNASMEGYEFQIFDNKTADGEFNDIYYFVKVNGEFKLFAKQFAG